MKRLAEVTSGGRNWTLVDCSDREDCQWRLTDYCMTDNQRHWPSTSTAKIINCWASELAARCRSSIDFRHHFLHFNSMAFVRLNKRCVMLCYLEVGRSKVKVTRPIDAETEMRHIFRRGRTTNFKLGRGMEYETVTLMSSQHAPWRQSQTSRLQHHVVNLMHFVHNT